MLFRSPFIRQLTLRVTPQEQGGCEGCRFLMMCKGQCPGHAADGDWRKRSRDCQTWFKTFEYLEERLVAVGERPVSLRSDRLTLEERMAEAWASGIDARIKDVLEGKAGVSTTDHDDHDDHWDFGGTKGGERV